MKKKHKQTGNVIIPSKIINYLEKHEIEIATILSEYFNTDVEFIIPIDDYKRKSADIRMFGVEWEMKSPIGASKSTIGNQFRFATKQSKNIIIDARRTKLNPIIVKQQILLEKKKRAVIKRVILIEKTGNVVEII